MEHLYHRHNQLCRRTRRPSNGLRVACLRRYFVDLQFICYVFLEESGVCLIQKACYMRACLPTVASSASARSESRLTSAAADHRRTAPCCRLSSCRAWRSGSGRARDTSGPRRRPQACPTVWPASRCCTCSGTDRHRAPSHTGTGRTHDPSGQ